MSAAVAAVLLADADAGKISLRVLLAFGLTYAIGFERSVRGSVAGDRTFSLVGIGSAVVGFLATRGAPNALAGVVTGIGFIGAGLIIRRDEGGMVEGVTTAATIFAAAAIGAAAGQGELELALSSTALVVLALELRHLPLLSALDGRRWMARFRDDTMPPRPMGTGHHPFDEGSSDEPEPPPTPGP